MIALKSLLKDMKVDKKRFTSFHVELRVKGYFTYSEVLMKAKWLIPLDDLPNGDVCTKGIS